MGRQEALIKLVQCTLRNASGVSEAVDSSGIGRGVPGARMTPI